jgi:hypothetical protein
LGDEREDSLVWERKVRKFQPNSREKNPQRSRPFPQTLFLLFTVPYVFSPAMRAAVKLSQLNKIDGWA